MRGVNSSQIIEKFAFRQTDRDRVKEFTYDYSYWSVSKEDERYDSQEKVCKRRKYILIVFFFLSRCSLILDKTCLEIRLKDTTLACLLMGKQAQEKRTQ